MLSLHDHDLRNLREMVRTRAEYGRMKNLWLKAGEAIYLKREAEGNKRHAEIVKHATLKLYDHDNFDFLTAVMDANHIPVSISEFLESDEFWKDQMSLWPALVPDVMAACPDVLIGQPHKEQALLGGATGTGKTAFGHTVNAYHLYCLSCFRQPQKLFNLTAATPIIFMFLSVSTTVTKRVIYQPFRTMFLGMPYARKWVTHDKYVESTLKLGGNMEVVPALASVQSMVGQAIAGCIVDEINFMSVIENSKQVPGLSGQGGHYDQAELVHTNIERRRKSRFITKGPSWGLLSISSSTRYKGDYLDRKIDEIEADENRDTSVLVFRRKQYEMQPKFQDPNYPRFRFLVGTETYPGRVLRDSDQEGQHYPSGAHIELVPTDYLKAFLKDPDGSSRDVIGVASLSISPFIAQRHKIVQAVLRWRGLEADQDPEEVAPRPHWVDTVDAVLYPAPNGEEGAVVGMPQWVESAFPPMEERRDPRFVHIDLSTASDRCGIGIVRVKRWEDRIRRGDNGESFIERMPIFEVECSVSIQPSALANIDIADVRRWIMQLKSFYGFNIYMVSYDGFQSKESRTVLNRAGVRSELVSVDITSEPYNYLRSCFYEDRIDLTDHELLRSELVSLEHVKTKDKIDHPPKGSKDVADAVAGAVFAASQSREVRSTKGFHHPEGRDPIHKRSVSIQRPQKVNRSQTRYRPDPVKEAPHEHDPEDDAE